MGRIIFWITVTIALAFAAREALYHGIRRNRVGEYGKLNTAFLRSNRYDAVIIGSSRAEVHYIPDILDSVTGMDFYNLGLEGADAGFALACLEAYLLHSAPPRAVVLDADYFMLESQGDTVYRFPRYFPYLRNPVLYDYLCSADAGFFYFRWIPFYSLPYTADGYLNAAIRGYTGLVSRFDRQYRKGYVPVPPGVGSDPDSVPATAKDYIISGKTFAVLNHLSALCKKHKIRLFVVFSPVYHRINETVLNRQVLNKAFLEWCIATGTVFLDYSNTSLSFKKGLFQDPVHMKPSGAALFSRKLAVAIRDILPSVH